MHFCDHYLSAYFRRFMKFQYKYFAAAIYAIVLFLDRLDLTIVNITLPAVAKTFHIPVTSTDWVSLSFLLALAIAIPISCWLGERFGFKKIYILSMLLFGFGSTLCAFAPNLPILLVLRFIHGMGGGMLIPVGMTIIYRTFDKSEYASITSFTFLPSLIAPAIAPFLGGVIQDLFGWQMVFLFSGPISLMLAVISMYTLRDERSKCSKKLDWIGFLLFSAILLDSFYTLSLIGHTGFLLMIVAGILSVCVLVCLFIFHEKSAPNPLIDLHYFSNDMFVKSNLIQLCFQICHFGAIYIVGIYLQIGVGMIASMAGLVMGMQAIGAICTSRYSVKLFNQHGAKLPITIGLVGVAVLSPFVLCIRSADMLGFALLLFFIRGLFSGLCGTPIQTLSVISFNKEDIASVNTLFNACRQVSISLGMAISSGLMVIGFNDAHLSKTSEIISKADLFQVFGLGFLAIPVVALLGVLITSGLKNHSLK
jgi:EmrB/QacA subfamily drug resistance transporter